MKMLGLNPMEQEIVDLTNEITRNGFIYFPEFCSIVFKKMREDDEEVKTEADVVKAILIYNRLSMSRLIVSTSVLC